MQSRFVSDFYCFVLRGKENPFRSASPSLFLRSSSAPNSMQVRSIEWVKNGSCTDFGRDLQGTCYGTTGKGTRLRINAQKQELRENEQKNGN